MSCLTSYRSESLDLAHGRPYELPTSLISTQRPKLISVLTFDIM